jgi:hypothetical protein
MWSDREDRAYEAQRKPDNPRVEPELSQLDAQRDVAALIRPFHGQDIP